MELRRNARGHRVVTQADRRQIVSEIEAGLSPAEAARKYELAIWTIRRWLKPESSIAGIKDNIEAGGPPSPTVAMKEYRELQEELRKVQTELKATRKSLATMTVDRDILRDAVEIASKKKWI